METHRLWQQGYRTRNREILVKKQRAYSKTLEAREKRRHYVLSNPIRLLLSEARKRAKKKNLKFNLTVVDLKIPDVCPVLGIPIILRGPRANWPSLDRYVPGLGYVVGNVYVISHRANLLKNDATIDEVEKILQYMRDHHG